MKSLSTRTWATFVLCALTCACERAVFEPVRDGLGAGVSLSGEVKVVTEADLLFVVDNSRSMQNEQEKLAQGFPALAQALDALDPPVAWRVGIITTSVDERFGPCTTGDASAAAQCSASFGGQGFSCEDMQCVRRFPDEAGRLMSAAGSPAVLDRGALSRSELERHFSKNAQMPLDGSRQEQPLRALRLALEAGGLRDFRRPNARLIAVVVSDEDDCSDSLGKTLALENSSNGTVDGCAHGARTGEGLDPTDEWASWFRDSGDVAFAALVGLTPGSLAPGDCVDDGCAASCGSEAGLQACEDECTDALQVARCEAECVAECESFCGSQAPGVRLADVAVRLQGALSSICESDFGPALASLARVLGIPERLPLPSAPRDPRAVFFEVVRRGESIDCTYANDWRLESDGVQTELVIEPGGRCRLLPDDVWSIRYIADVD